MSDSRLDYISKPAGPLRATLRVPGDKSVSHRAIIMGAIANGTTRIHDMLASADTIATANVFRSMGVRIDEQPGCVIVHGAGRYGLKAPTHALDFGNSGTSVRLLMGILAGQTFDSVLTGDDSLQRRPMRRVAEPLSRMGAVIRTTAEGTLPVRVEGGHALHAIDYSMPVASAQLKSSLLLAGLYAEGKTRVLEPAVTRDHTERMLPDFGVQVQADAGRVTLTPGELQGTTVHVPGDISSAAFFLVAASICPGSELILENVGVNPTRDAVIAILRQMGADIEVIPNVRQTGEPVATLRVRAAPLHGIDIPAHLVPIAIDEFPAIMVAAACAEGQTVLAGAEELRVKESDRIEAIAAGLRALGIVVETRPDGMVVSGGQFQGGEIDSHGDHRIAMAFAVAALRADGPVHIRDCINVNTSFPGFVDVARQAGMDLATTSPDD